MSHDTLWFYIKSGMMNDEQFGPLRQDQFAIVIEEQRLKPDTKVASPTATRGTWVTLRSTEFYIQLLKAQDDAKRARAEQVAKQREDTAAQQASTAPLRVPPPPPPVNLPQSAPTNTRRTDTSNPTEPVAHSPVGSSNPPSGAAGALTKSSGNQPVTDGSELLEAKNFVTGLFDLTFTRFAAPQILRVLWVVVLVLAALATVILICWTGLQLLFLMGLFAAGTSEPTSVRRSPPSFSFDGETFTTTSTDDEPEVNRTTVRGATFLATIFGLLAIVSQLVIGLLSIFTIVCLYRVGFETVMILFDIAKSARKLRAGPSE